MKNQIAYDIITGRTLKCVFCRQCDWGLFLGTVRLGEVALAPEQLTVVLETMEVDLFLSFVQKEVYRDRSQKKRFGRISF